MHHAAAIRQPNGFDGGDACDAEEDVRPFSEDAPGITSVSLTMTRTMTPLASSAPRRWSGLDGR